MVLLSKNKIIAFILAGVGVLILLSLAYFFITPTSSLSPTSAPSNTLEEGTLFLVESDAGPWYSIRSRSNGGDVEVLPEFDGQVVDYARRGNTEALIHDVEGAHHVSYRIDGGEWQTINASPSEKATLALSADGRAIAYADRIDMEQSSLNLLSWMIELYDIEAQTALPVAPGYAPHFVALPGGEDTWEALYFSTPYGIGAYEPVSNKGFYFTTLIPSSTEYPAIFDTDGTHVALYDTQRNEHMLFSVTSALPLSVRTVATTSPLVSGVIANNTLWGISQSETGAEIIRMKLEGAYEYTQALFGGQEMLVSIIE